MTKSTGPNIRKKMIRAFRQFLYSFLYRNNISSLAKAFGSDKEGGHFYARHYQNHFRPLRLKKINLLEIGVGGYEDPRQGGESLRMWKAYFRRGNIFGVDIHDKTYHNEKRIKTFKGSQVDLDFLRKIKEEMRTIDIIIDDGSHFNDHVITTFKILFPLLSPDGIYVIEDLQTSYWDRFSDNAAEDASKLVEPLTSMNFLKPLVDGLNYEEFMVDGYAPTYFDENIKSIHFYHNLVFIYKGKNNEGSNFFGKRFS